MSEIKHFGYCADGHLHGIKPEFLQTALENKLDFTSSMFTEERYDENNIRNRDFIRLEPTNCPYLKEILDFGRLTEPRNMLPDKQAFTLPFDPDRLPAVAWLMNFEDHLDRISETEQEVKMKLFRLIVDFYPELGLEDIAESMTYETLRQKFLRKFWSIEEQQKVYIRLLASVYPSAENQPICDYILYWLERFTFTTAYCIRDIVYELTLKVPPECVPILTPFLVGCKVYHVFDEVRRNEHIFEKIYKRFDSPDRTWLGVSRSSPIYPMLVCAPIAIVISEILKYSFSYFFKK